MRVLLVSNGFPPSGQWGTEYYTHQLATGLAARGHAVSVFWPRRDGSRPRYTLERGGGADPILTFALHNAGDRRKSIADSYRNPRVEAIFARLVEELRPDVVHFTHLLWGLSVGLPGVAARLGARTVVTLTDFGLLCHRGQLFDPRLAPCGGPLSDSECARCIRRPGPFGLRAPTRLLKAALVEGLAAVGGAGLVVTPRAVGRRRASIAAALEAVDHFVAPTRALAAAFELAGLARERTTQLYYGVDERPYRGARPTRDPASFRFGYLGQFEPHKGLHRLFEALRVLTHRLPESLEPWSVHLFGNPVGGRNRHYVDRSWSEDLSERVRFRGAFAPLEAPRILAGLDALVVPSQWTENAPLTVLQARIAGLPVVASDVPGIREVLEPGPRVRLVAPQDARALADALGDFVRERPRPDSAPRPAIGHAEHLERIEAIYAAARETEPTARRTGARRLRPGFDPCLPARDVRHDASPLVVG